MELNERARFLFLFFSCARTCGRPVDVNAASIGVVFRPEIFGQRKADIAEVGSKENTTLFTSQFAYRTPDDTAIHRYHIVTVS